MTNEVKHMKNKHFLKLIRKAIVGALLITTTAPVLAANSFTANANYTVKYGSNAQVRLDRLNVLMAKHANSPIETKLIVVNDFFNAFFYREDSVLWGQDDYWASLIEFLGVGMGDCEDYAIAKLEVLTRMGVDKEKLRLIYTTANDITPHMVLGYYSNQSARPLIMDNIQNEVLPMSVRVDLKQVYSFNDVGVWVIVNGKSKFAGNSKRLSLWGDLNTRTAMRLPTENYKII